MQHAVSIGRIKKMDMIEPAEIQVYRQDGAIAMALSDPTAAKRPVSLRYRQSGGGTDANLTKGVGHA